MSNLPAADNNTTIEQSIRLPPGALITDACTMDIEGLEMSFYARPSIYSFKRDEWFHVAVIQRLFAHIRILNARLDITDWEKSANTISHTLLDALLSISNTPPNETNGDETIQYPIHAAATPPTPTDSESTSPLIGGRNKRSLGTVSLQHSNPDSYSTPKAKKGKIDSPQN